MNIIKTIYICITATSLPFLYSCDKYRKSNASEEKIEIKTTNGSFPFADIPALITDKESKINYMAIHFWDKIDFNDSTLYKDTLLLNSGMKNYISFISLCNKEMQIKSVQKFTESSSKHYNNFSFIRNCAEDLLYNPNSSLRNDDIYEIILRSFITSGNIDRYIKEKYSKQLSLVSMNQVETMANDFSYKNNNGGIKRLYELKSDYTLLLFYNPVCDACKKITDALQNSEINTLIEKKTIKLIAIYPDNDIKEWKESLSLLPSNWIKGYDYNHIIEDKPLYDLKAIPTLYLLDKNKKVLLKDASINEVENYLLKNIQLKQLKNE